MAKVIGIIACLALVIGVFIVMLRTFRDIEKIGWNKIDNYDERQILSRGKAFQAGFLVTMCSAMIFAILTSVMDAMRGFAPNFLFIAAFAGITVFCIIAIWTDSFTTDKIRAGKYFALFFMIGLANLAAWILNKDWITAGEFLASDDLVSFLIGVSFITIAVLIEVKSVKERGEADQ